MKYYLIQMMGCIEPEKIGPFKSNKARDEVALELHESEGYDREEDSMFWMDVDSKGNIRAGAYSHGFFEERVGEQIEGEVSNVKNNS